MSKNTSLIVIVSIVMLQIDGNNINTDEIDKVLCDYCFTNHYVFHCYLYVRSLIWYMYKH